MREAPLVSVVMVVCNVDRFLAEAIQGILDQTFRDFEFVIVDFGSTDKSKEIISSYAARDSRIKFHEIPHCRLSEARDAAGRLAAGKYIAITDADDVSLPDRLLWQVEFMERHPQVGVVGGGVEFIDAAGTSLTNAVTAFGTNLHNPIENSEIQSEMLIRCTFWAAVLVRRDAFLKVGGYRPVFMQAEDYDMYMRISDHYELANLKQVVFKYRIHSHQVSIRKREQQALYILAVPASAIIRRNGKPDPLDRVQEITAELLMEMGVTEEKQQVAVAGYFRGWIQIMCAAGEWSTALNAAADMLKSSDWKLIGTNVRFDMRTDVAKLYWKNKRFLKSITTAAPALITEPRLAKRFLKDRLRGFRVVRAARRVL